MTETAEKVDLRKATPKYRNVYFTCENCAEFGENECCSPREDIGVMPDGTWLCYGCYSDCDKGAHGLVASDVEDFEWPRFEDLPRPAPYLAINERDELIQALRWYEMHAAGCRKISSEGDLSRKALNDDGGKLARSILEKVQTP